MKLSKVLDRLARSKNDCVELRRSARDVGHELPSRRLEVLREFRAQLSVLSTEGADSFALGYRQAMLDIVAAFDAACQPAIEEETALRIAKRSEWKECLTALLDEPLRPRDLESRLGRDQGQVSRQLKAMRAASLVEIVPAREGDDLRTKLHRLTALGERIVQKLKPELSKPIKDAISAAFGVTAHLAADPCPSVAALERGIVGRIAQPELAIRFFVDQAKRWGFVDREEGHYVSSTLAHSAVADLLRGTQQQRRSLIEAIISQAPTGLDTILVRAESAFSEWESLLLFADDMPFKQRRACNWVDLDLLKNTTPAGATLVVYENVSLLRRAQAAGEPFAEAPHRCCFISHGEHSPEGVRAISLPEFREHKAQEDPIADYRPGARW